MGLSMKLVDRWRVNFRSANVEACGNVGTKVRITLIVPSQLFVLHNSGCMKEAAGIVHLRGSGGDTAPRAGCGLQAERAATLMQFERLRDRYSLIYDVDHNVEYSRRNPLHASSLQRA